MLKRLTAVSLAFLMGVYPLISVHAATTASASSSRSRLRVLGAGSTDSKLSAEQIDNIMAPIALYPDPLLAQMLPASTFVEQIDQAARFLRANNNQATLVDQQTWDVSVKSVAHYPDIIFKMSEKLDWTTALGQAYVAQAADVFTSIQRLRKRAEDAGFLKTTPQQTVIVEKEIIKVVPAQAQMIYVPVYDPQVVYVQQTTAPSTGAVVATAAVAFGVGLAIGAWLNNDCDWYGHSVYYHGWRGTGWVSHSSTVIRVNNSFYVNNRYSTVHVNQAIVNRNVNYNNINHYSNVNRNVNYNNVNRNNVNVNNVNRNNVNTNNVNRNNVNTNNVNRNNVNNSNLNKNINTNNRNMDEFRGRTNSPTTNQTKNNANRATTQRNNTAFGGNTNGAQTRQQSERGATSRTSAEKSRSQPERQKPQRSGGGRRKN